MRVKAYIKELTINREPYGSYAELRVIIDSGVEKLFDVVDDQREIYLTTDTEDYEHLMQEQEKNNKILLELWSKMKSGTRVD